MPDAACGAVLLLSAGAAPGLRPLISPADAKKFSCGPYAAWGKHCWVDACIHGGVWCPDHNKGSVERGILGHESAYAFMRPALGSQAPGYIPQWRCGLGCSQSDGNHCLEKPLFLVCEKSRIPDDDDGRAQTQKCFCVLLDGGSSAVVGPRLYCSHSSSDSKLNIQAARQIK